MRQRVLDSTKNFSFFEFRGNRSGSIHGFLHLAPQPRTGVSPVAVHRAWRNTQHIGRLIATQPCEESQFDEARFDWIALGEFCQGIVQGE